MMDEDNNISLQYVRSAENILRFQNNDEIHIVVQRQDLCLTPCESFLHIYGKITKDDGVNVVTTTKLINMTVCRLFKDIRYDLENTGWLSDDAELPDASGNFDVVLPLNYILSFAEDYCRVTVNGKHDLILTRLNADLNAVIQTPPTENFKITLNKIEWLLPHIKLADKPKIQLLNYIAKDLAESMSFRSWETCVYPTLPLRTRHVWAVKTSTQLVKPRYVVLGFETARRNDPQKNASEFDYCRIRDVKLFLNSHCYPHGNWNLDISNNQYAILYNMYIQLQTVYYNKEAEPLLSKPHSTCHALTSAAKNKGVDIDNIRKAAGWSAHSQTFARFYELPVDNDKDAFAMAILDN
ncbi:uncharacterized protein [Neodiprion pinetum]|uniref:uncharacterized protein n=1 Tax=Neodiprion pinetum TaxID=441929 RepID=UPI003720E676